MVDAKLKVRKNYILVLPTKWKNPDGTLANLAGWTAAATVRDNFAEAGGVVVVQFDSSSPSANGDTVTVDSVAATVTVTLKEATTVLFDGNQDYFLEITLINPSGEAERGITVQMLTQPSVR